MWKYKWYLILGIIFTIVSNLFGIIPAQLVRYALDLVIDYFTYVIVPALFMLRLGYLPEPLGFPLATTLTGHSVREEQRGRHVV